MASSRNSTNLNDQPAWIGRAERALKDCLARVSFSADTPAVAIAYSGGLDSSVLLHLAHQFAQRHGLRLFAFHIHHGLNPRADDWLSHCEREARLRGIEFVARKVEVKQDAGLGVEEAARHARYAALGDLCREQGVSLLLTAHHEDDQAETVLLQLLRGAGLPGLSGMPAYAEGQELLGQGVALARPLLSVSRKALAALVVRLGIAHIDDDSNDDQRYRRNAIRHRVAPVLSELFPSYAQCIARSSGHIQHAQGLLSDLAEMDLSASRIEARAGALDLNKLKTLSGHRVDNLLRHWLAKQGMRMPSDAQLQQIHKQMLHAATDSEPHYRCGSLHLHRIGNTLVMERQWNEPPISKLMLTWQGQDSIAVPEWNGRLIFQASEEGGISRERLSQGPLVLHSRTGGERMKLGASRPSKSLKHLYQEAGIFPVERRWLPLVSLQDRLVFAAGLGMDYRCLDALGGIRLQWEKL